MYAADNRGYVVTYWKNAWPNNTALLWHETILTCLMPTTATTVDRYFGNSNLAYCPSVPRQYKRETQYDNWRYYTYGGNYNNSDFSNIKPSSHGVNEIVFLLDRLPTAEASKGYKIPLIGETSFNLLQADQDCYIFSRGENYLLLFRHGMRSNILLGDGRVESIGKAEAETSLNFPKAKLL
ncbi:hypothetical protein SDC9_183117 [bioreactor metagenome]|uniref:Uncharacterized protein n=1 Tax=bioreactor metagenome TaxID=1076179 RepID=A0A645HBW8_9ZZZZ